jgi:hypothetical protein
MIDIFYLSMRFCLSSGGTFCVLEKVRKNFDLSSQYDAPHSSKPIKQTEGSCEKLPVPIVLQFHHGAR